MSHPAVDPTLAAVSDPVDHLGITAEQLALLHRVVALSELPVDPRIRHQVLSPGDRGPNSEGGAVTLQSFAGPKVERATAYRFQRTGLLNEHLFHAWPAAGYDYPALTTVIFEMKGWIVLGADLIPLADVAFYREYYARWHGEHSELVQEFWPHLQPHLMTPSPPPDAYFTNQLGSRLAVLANLRTDALPVALGYVRGLTTLWTQLCERAEPTPEEHRAHVDARRWNLMKKAYKGLDYHSPAGPSLASVLGWEGANLMFDHVFGPDEPPQPLGGQRNYLGGGVSAHQASVERNGPNGPARLRS